MRLYKVTKRLLGTCDDRRALCHLRSLSPAVRAKNTRLSRACNCTREVERVALAVHKSGSRLATGSQIRR